MMRDPIPYEPDQTPGWKELGIEVPETEDPA